MTNDICLLIYGIEKFVCDISGNGLLLIREKKNVVFSCWKEKNNLVRKKNHTLVLNGPPLSFNPLTSRPGCIP